jgi:hypothetical protein
MAKLTPPNHGGKRFVKCFTKIGDRKNRRNFEVNFTVAAEVSRLQFCIGKNERTHVRCCKLFITRAISSAVCAASVPRLCVRLKQRSFACDSFSSSKTSWMTGTSCWI